MHVLKAEILESLQILISEKKNLNLIIFYVLLLFYIVQNYTLLYVIIFYYYISYCSKLYFLPFPASKSVRNSDHH